MKLKYIAIFALAFAVCAGWNLLFDAPKTAKPAVETAAKLQEEKEPQGSWPSPLRPLEIRVYPYLHFHEAMDNKIKKIPVYVAISAISKPMQHAVVATEDRRFYDHGAIDPIGIIRAVLVNIESGETVEGGSTISQQVVKNAFLYQAGQQGGLGQVQFFRRRREVRPGRIVDARGIGTEVGRIQIDFQYFIFGVVMFQ